MQCPSWVSLVTKLDCLGRVDQLPATKLPCCCRSPPILSSARSNNIKTHDPLARLYNAASTHNITTKSHTELRYSHAPCPSSTASENCLFHFLQGTRPWNGVSILKGLCFSFYPPAMLVEEHLSPAVVAEESLCNPCPGPLWSWC